jgi:hypothetical protein
MIIESIVKNPSLELNWLPNSIRKGLPLPQIYFVSGVEYGGAYYKVQNHDNDWGDLTSRPVITVATDSADNMASTLAHEYRHHWQTYAVGNLENIKWSNVGNYRNNIIKYFRSSWSEWDALRYEIAQAPSDANLLWWDWIQEESIK